MMAQRLKNGLKRLRGSQPLNRVATSTVRTALALARLRSEFVIKHLHRVGTVRSRLPNGRVLRLWSRGDDWVSNQVYWRGWDGYEPETIPLFFRLASRAAVTLDVGAYVGLFALLAGHANPSGRVFAFEPMPRIFERLQRNVALNRLHNVECVPSAVGAVDGTAAFYHVAAAVPSSSSLSREFMGRNDDVTQTSVPVVTLDRFVKDKGLAPIDLVKIDTESTEPAVLRGMAATLRCDLPTIVCEVLPGRGSERALEDLLLPLGYRFYALTPEGPEPRDRIVGHPEWLNYLFTTLGPTDIGTI